MSTMFPCSSWAGDSAIAFVDAGWDKFSGYGLQAFNLAKTQIEGLDGFSVPFHTWNAAFEDDGTLSGFLRPVKPELVEITPPTDFTIPDAPTLNFSAIGVEPAPAEPSELVNLPTLNLPGTPGELSAERPGAAPAMLVPDMPSAPVIIEPDAPELLAVLLPAVPDINISRFEEVPPEFTAAAPSETLDFTEVLYTSPLLDRVREQLTAMMDGQYYLPRAVADALWEQSISTEERGALRQSQEARDQFAAKGWDEPNGLLDKRLAIVRQDIANRRSEAGREVYIRSEQIALENLRFSVQQSIGLESTLLQGHLAVEARRFELVVKGRDVALAVFNARVTQYNAAVQAFNVRVDAYKAYLEGQRTEVDIYRAQVEAAKTVGDLNESRVRMFAEQVRASLAKADLYRAQIEGFRAVLDAERAKIDGFRAEVDAYNGLVDAYKTEWDAYRSRIDGEIAKGNMYDTLAKVYATRVGAWKTKGDMAVAKNDAELKQAEAFLRQHEGTIRAILGKLEGSRALIAAQSATNDARARIYTAEATVEAAAVEADTRAFNAILERSRAKVEMALRDAGLQIEQSTKIASLMLEAMKSSASVSGQLAAASFSAVNFGASVSSSNGYSKGCSQSINYSGELIGLP